MMNSKNIQQKNYIRGLLETNKITKSEYNSLMRRNMCVFDLNGPFDAVEEAQLKNMGFNFDIISYQGGWSTTISISS